MFGWHVTENGPKSCKS